MKLSFISFKTYFLSMGDKITDWLAWLVIKGNRAMGMTPPKDLLYKRFEKLYDLLLKEEEVLEKRITQYVTEDDATLDDVDASFDMIKSYLKEVRKLAIEMKKEPEKL